MPIMPNTQQELAPSEGSRSNNPAVLSTEQLDAVHAVKSSPRNRKMKIVNGPTGFGKTRVGLALADDFLKQGGVVLWVTMDWELVSQANEEMLKLYPAHRKNRRYIGGDKDSLTDLATSASGMLFFTTLSTWNRRLQTGKLPIAVGPKRELMVVWDECHFAVNTKLGNTLLQHYLNGTGEVPEFIGLSATPIENKLQFTELVYGIPFADLVGNRVARPLHINVKTGVVWDPILRNRLVSPKSLNVLAQNKDRNQLVVDEVLKGRQDGRFKKILVFACNIKNAIELNKMISEAGAPSAVLHSGQTKYSSNLAIAKFRNGEIDVLVNVDKLIEGFDCPEIDTVVLARPTTSKPCLQQMIGRGARLMPSKKFFHVVEFSDTIISNSDDFYHVSSLIGDAAKSSATIRKVRHQAPVRHCEPEHPKFENVYLPDVGNIPYVIDQTFGVEIEITTRAGVPEMNEEWRKTGAAIAKCLTQFATSPVCPDALNYHENCDPSRWVVERDCSAGWEVVSPILQNAEGFLELQRICDGLTEFVSNSNLHINYRTGLHVTLGTRLNTDERLRGFMKRIQRLEPGLFTLVSPSRLYDFDGYDYDTDECNEYCMPICESISDVEGLRIGAFIREGDNRYCTVNLTHAYKDVQKLEIRMHNGTTEFQKIAPWISLWMQIFNRSRYAWEGDGYHGDVFNEPDKKLDQKEALREDIFHLLEAEGIYLNADMVRLLTNRRIQLRKSWGKVIPKRVSSWAQAGWYANSAQATTATQST